MVKSTVSSNLAYFTCLSSPTASGSGYAGLVTAARAFTIFLLNFLAILSSSPTAPASPALRGVWNCWLNRQHLSLHNQPTRTDPETVVLMTVQGFPLDTSMNHSETASKLQTSGPIYLILSFGMIGRAENLFQPDRKST